MPRNKGASAVFQIALDGEPLVDISSEARGLDGVTLAQTEDTRTVPGGGDQVVRQKLGYKEGTSSFTCDENTITGPLFWGRHGRAFDCEYNPRGTASGAPKRSWTALGEITHSMEARGVRRFSVTLQHVGLITDSVN